MFIFVNFNPTVLIYSAGIVFCLNTNYNLFLEAAALPDFTARVLIDMFFINNFYFLWTNLWYLSTYFIVLNTYLILFRNRLTTISFFYVVIFIVLLLFITFIEWANNFFFTPELFPLAYKENTLLTNAVNRVHPFLLHSSFFLLFFTIFRKFDLSYQNTNLSNFFALVYLKKSLVVILTTLYLGSWWASQEGSWGGWWNWDPSEVFGLYILYRILSLYHFKENIVYLVHCRYYLVMSIIYLYVFYCTMQINFSLVSHNFGFRSLKSFNPELFFFTSIIFLYYWIYLRCRSLKSKLSIIKVIRDYHTFIVQVIFVVSTIVFYTIILTLVNNFLWNTIHLKLYLIKINYKYYVNFILVVLVTLTYRGNILLALTAITYVKSIFYILVLFSKKFRGGIFIFVIHFTLVSSLIFSYFSCYSSIDMWNIFYTGRYNEDCFNYSLNSIKVDSQFNYFKNFTAYEGKSFDLVLSKSFMLQKYFPSGVLEHYTTTLIDFFTPSLNSYVFTFIFLIVNSVNRRLKL